VRWRKPCCFRRFLGPARHRPFGAASANVLHPQKTVPQIVGLGGIPGGVHRDQVLVGPQPVYVGVVMLP
jgi:hypothetical protein